MKEHAKDGLFAMFSKKFVSEVSSNLKKLFQVIFICQFLLYG